MTWNLGKKDSRCAYSGIQCHRQYRTQESKKSRVSMEFTQRTNISTVLKPFTKNISQGSQEKAKYHPKAVPETT